MNPERASGEGIEVFATGRRTALIASFGGICGLGAALPKQGRQGFRHGRQVGVAQSGDVDAAVSNDADVPVFAQPIQRLCIDSQQREQPAAPENVYRAERTEHYEDSSFDRAGAWGGVAKVGDQLRVDPGGTNGTYAAIRFRDQTDYHTPSYVVNVEASASGGTSPYTFRWQQTGADSSAATYLFVWSGIYTRSVTATDANGHQKSSTATIHCNPPGGVGGASDGDRYRVPVPLGGTLTIIWGNGGLVSASSKDAGVASAAASGSEIAITGVSSGETRIVARTSGGEYHVPVRVGGGG